MTGATKKLDILDYFICHVRQDSKSREKPFHLCLLIFEFHGHSHEIEISFVPEYKAGSFRFIPSRFSLGGVLCCVYQVLDSLPRLRDFCSSERLRTLNCKCE